MFRRKTKSHFILIVGDSGVFFVRHNVAAPLESFFAAAHNKNAETTILNILAKYPRVPLTIFADTLAQDFRKETLPSLHFFDRVKLIRRRVQQAFPQACLTACLKLSRTQLLLAALHANGPVSVWLEKVKSRVPCVGLLPVECAGIAPRLMPEAASGWILMLTRTRTGGFRQIVTHKGELVFTRLTPNLPPNATTDEIAVIAARDIRASLGYLSRMGLDDSSQLHVLLVMPEKMHAAFADLKLPVRALQMLSPRKAAVQLDLPFMASADDAYGDLLFAAWVAGRHKPRLSLASSEVKAIRQTKSIQSFGLRAAIAALLLSIGMTGWQARDLFAAIYDNHQKAAQLDALKQKYAGVQAAAAPITEPLGKLRVALERQRLFSAPASTPWMALQEFEHGLGAPARLVRLEWQNEGKTGEVIRADVRLVQDPPSSSADREETVARFQQVAQNVIHATPGYTVDVTRYPFPALPQEALTNVKMEKESAPPDTTAEFMLKETAP